jgi:DNA adenine methylase
MELENFLNNSKPQYLKDNRTKSLIKWAGGKGRVLEYLSPYLLSTEYRKRNNFYEPFCGSMTVSFCVENANLILNDKNKYLINFFNEVKNRPEKVVKKINKLRTEYELAESQKDFYNEIRDKFNNHNLVEANSLTNASYFWFLNKTGFNGMYRETKKGDYNIPFGQRDCPKASLRAFKAVSERLSNASLHSKDFSFICDMVKSQDAVYLDPPYLPISETSNFSSYTKKGFNVEMHQKLAKYMSDMSEKGALIVMSNSNSLLTKEIYSGLKGFSTKVINVSRSISAKSSSRGKVEEVIISNLKL